MKRLIPLLLVLTLASCTTFGASFKNPVSKSDFAIAEATYGTVLAAANGYRKACVAKTIPTTCRAIVRRLQAADGIAYSAISRARNFIHTNPDIDAAAVFSAATSAIDAFREIAASNGVK